jgi:hypothetical protein
MDAELLAIRHDVDAGVLLELEPDECRIALCLGEVLAVGAPAGP